MEVQNVASITTTLTTIIPGAVDETVVLDALGVPKLPGLETVQTKLNGPVPVVETEIVGPMQLEMATGDALMVAVHCAFRSVGKHIIAKTNEVKSFFI